MSETEKKLVPMRELEKMTDMSRSAINFYIKEGVLPRPQKTAKNMAYYDEDFIKKLKMVDAMRSEHYSMNQIKKLMGGESGSVSDYYLQVLESVNRLMPYQLDDEPVQRERIGETGLEESLIDYLIRIKVLIPLDDGASIFPKYSLTICRLIKFFTDFGVPQYMIKEIASNMKDISRIEKKAFVEYIRGPMIENGMPKEEQVTVVGDCIQNINTLLPILHLQLIKYPTESILRSESGPAD